MSAVVKENGGSSLPPLELVDVGLPDDNLTFFQSAKQDGDFVGLPP